MIRSLLLAVVLLSGCAPPAVADGPTVRQVVDRYGFAANGNSGREQAHLMGWGIEKPEFTWDGFYKRLVDHPQHGYRTRHGEFPRGVLLELPFGVDEKNGGKYLRADQYLLTRDGTRHITPQPQAVRDFTEAGRRWVLGEYTDGQEMELWVYLGQLDVPELERYAAHGPTAYRDRMIEALRPVLDIPGAVVLFDSAHDLPQDHAGTGLIEDLVAWGRAPGVEPRTMRACPWLHPCHTIQVYDFWGNSDPTRRLDNPAYQWGAWREQIGGEFLEIHRYQRHTSWDDVAKVLARGNVPCAVVKDLPNRRLPPAATKD